MNKLAVWSGVVALGSTLSGVPPQLAAPETDALVARASRSLNDYLSTLSAIVCEERYHQRSEIDRPVPSEYGAPRIVTDLLDRNLVSDLLLVQLPGARGFVAFRDVYSVDGTPVRDRADRLVKLFLQPTGDALEQAARIRDESARYNIGSAIRDINVPTFALQFLLPQVRGRFTFTARGSEQVDATLTSIVTYQEVARPTLIRGKDDEDVPASGQLWIDPTDATVLKTRLETKASGKTAQIDVIFKRQPPLTIPLPSEMQERHKAGHESTLGLATYTNFRQFKVETFEEIRK